MKPLFTLSCALTIVLLSMSAALAQDRSFEERETFRRLVSIQMVESLESPLATIRQQTLKNAIVFGTLYPERVDFSSTVRAIARAAEHDASSSNRRLAVAALRAIGSYRANQVLAELQAMPDTEYRAVVAGVLSEYHRSDLTGSL
jgi:hypothetical protein